MSWLFSKVMVEAYANSHSLPELVAEYSEATCSAGVPSAQLNVMPTQHPFWRNDKMMDASNLSRFGLTCAVLTDDLGVALLTWFLADSRVRTYPLQGLVPELMVSVPGCGERWHESSVRFDPVSSSWKTAHCLWEEDLPWSSVTLPKWGSMRNGHVFQHPTLTRPINATASGLWQTIVADDSADRKAGKWNSRGEPKLSAQVMNPKYWPTPNSCKASKDLNLQCSGDGRAKPNKLGWAVAQRTWPTATATASKGWSKNHKRAMTDDRLDYSVERESFQPGQQTPPMRLNPDWVEWLMGWPIGWTELRPLAMDRCHCAQPLHGDCLQTFDCWKRHFSR